MAEKDKDKEKKGGGALFSGLKKLGDKIGGKKTKGEDSSKSASKCFGVPLASLALRDGLPVILKKCLDFLDTDAHLSIEGLFRTVPSLNDVQKLQKLFEDAADPETVQLAGADPHTVGGLVKRFFRDLPEPIFANELYDKWSAAQSLPSKDEQIREMSRLLHILPPINRASLKALFRLLSRLLQHSQQNKLNSTVLGVVWQPNLVWSTAPGHNSLDSLKMSADGTMMGLVVGLMVENLDRFFPDANAGTPASQSPAAFTPQPNLADVLGPPGPRGPPPGPYGAAPTQTYHQQIQTQLGVPVTGPSAPYGVNPAPPGPYGAPSPSYGANPAPPGPYNAPSPSYTPTPDYTTGSSPSNSPSSYGASPVASAMASEGPDPYAGHTYPPGPAQPKNPGLTVQIPPTQVNMAPPGPPGPVASQGPTPVTSPALAPRTPVTPQTPTTAPGTPKGAPQRQVVMYNGYIQGIALCDYNAVEEGRLHFQRDQQIWITKKHEDGWWEGWSRGARGFFPAAFVYENAV